MVYNPFRQRWFATSAHVAFADNPDTILLAVSRSSDPTEGWTGFSMVRNPSARGLADFATLGFDAEAVYVKAGIIEGEECVQRIVVVPHADLLAPAPTMAHATVLENGECFGGLSPTVNLDGTGPPFYLLQTESFIGKASVVSISGPLGAPTIARRDVATRAYPYAPPAAQPHAPTQKEPIRVFYSITAGSVLRNGAIWSVETVGYEGRAALRWLEVDAKQATVLQEGVITDPALHFYNGSIAVNDGGDVVIGFNGSGATDPSGVTVFGPATLVKAGVDDFGLKHWGDYSATVVDPADPVRFWTFQEWVSADDVYSTQITELVVGGTRRRTARSLFGGWW